jgi:hypothetical protein
MDAEFLRLLLVWMAGWIHVGQLEVIEFPRKGNRLPREQLVERRPRFTCDQRRLAVKGRLVGRRRPTMFGIPVRPETILALVSQADRPEVRRFGASKRTAPKHIIHRHGREPASALGQRMPWKAPAHPLQRDRRDGLLGHMKATTSMTRWQHAYP